MSSSYPMTCLAGGSGGGAYYPQDTNKADQIAQLAATRQAAMLAQFMQELEEDRAEAAEVGDELMSEEANAACLRIARGLFDSLVWHPIPLTVTVSATNSGGASVVLTNKDRSKRLAIKVPRGGGDARTIQIGSDNIAHEGSYEFQRAAEYVKWFL